MSEEEEWRPAPKYEGRYEVSSFGRVRCLPFEYDMIRHGKPHTVKRSKNRLLNLNLRPTGYFEVLLCRDNVRTYCRVHRLVAAVFLPNPLNLPQVNHIDGVKTNNHVSNLEWCSAKHNIHHAHRTGLTNMWGENNHFSKYPDYKVSFIKAIVKLKLFSDEAIGEFIGVPKSLVKNVRLGQTRKATPASDLRIVSITSPNQESQ